MSVPNPNALISSLSEAEFEQVSIAALRSCLDEHEWVTADFFQHRGPVAFWVWWGIWEEENYAADDLAALRIYPFRPALGDCPSSGIAWDFDHVFLSGTTVATWSDWLVCVGADFNDRLDSSTSEKFFADIRDEFNVFQEAFARYTAQTSLTSDSTKPEDEDTAIIVETGTVTLQVLGLSSRKASSTAHDTNQETTLPHPYNFTPDEGVAMMVRAGILTPEGNLSEFYRQDDEDEDDDDIDATDPDFAIQMTGIASPAHAQPARADDPETLLDEATAADDDGDDGDPQVVTEAASPDTPTATWESLYRSDDVPHQARVIEALNRQDWGTFDTATLRQVVTYAAQALHRQVLNDIVSEVLRDDAEEAWALMVISTKALPWAGKFEAWTARFPDAQHRMVATGPNGWSLFENMLMWSPTGEVGKAWRTWLAELAGLVPQMSKAFLDEAHPVYPEYSRASVWAWLWCRHALRDTHRETLAYLLTRGADPNIALPCPHPVSLGSLVARAHPERVAERPEAATADWQGPGDLAGAPAWVAEQHHPEDHPWAQPARRMTWIMVREAGMVASRCQAADTDGPTALAWLLLRDTGQERIWGVMETSLDLRMLLDDGMPTTGVTPARWREQWRRNTTLYPAVDMPYWLLPVEWLNEIQGEDPAADGYVDWEGMCMHHRDGFWWDIWAPWTGGEAPKEHMAPRPFTLHYVATLNRLSPLARARQALGAWKGYFLETGDAGALPIRPVPVLDVTLATRKQLLDIQLRHQDTPPTEAQHQVLRDLAAWAIASARPKPAVVRSKDPRPSIVLFSEKEVALLLSKKDRDDSLKMWAARMEIKEGEEGYLPRRRPLAQAHDALPGIDALLRSFPHFGDIVRMLRDHVVLSTRGNGAFSLPPLLMVGPPGTGKTFFFQEMAQLVRTSYAILNMESVDSASVITGVSRGWGSAQPGFIFDNLMPPECTANPIVLLDEIDKISGYANHPVGPALLPLLERHSAAKFRDCCVDIMLDASHINWVATANDISKMPLPLLSRFEILHVPNPDFHARCLMAQHIYAAILKRHSWGPTFAPTLSDTTVQALCRPEGAARDLRKVLQQALAAAAMAQRDEVLVQDLKVPHEPSVHFPWDRPLARLLARDQQESA